jgi:hypothetical protein
MAASERKVGISIILKDKMSSALKKADKQAKKLRKSGDNIAKSFKKAAKPFAVLAAAAAAVGAATFVLTKRVSEFGDMMIKNAQRLNLSTDAFQKFDHAMQLSGTSMQANRGALTRFARTARDAVNGVKIAEEAFVRLGISVRNNDGSFKGTEELILEVSDAFSGMPSTIEKTALMMDLFGRSGADMAQFLSLGSKGLKEVGDDAARLGGIMTEKAAKGSEKFIDALTRMDLAFDGLIRDIGGHFQPMFTKAMESTANSIVSLRKSFTPVYKDFMRNSKQVAKVVIPVMGFISKAVIGFGTTVLLTYKSILMAGNQIISGFIKVNNAALKAFEFITGISIAPLANDFETTALVIDSEMANIIDASASAMGAIDNLSDAVSNVNTKIYTTADAVDASREAAEKLSTVSKELTDEEIANYKKILDWRRRSEEDYTKAVESAAQARLDYQIMITNKIAEDREKAMEQEKERMQAMREEYRSMAEEAVSIGSSIGDSFSSGFTSAEEGQSKWAEGFKSAGEEASMQTLDWMEKRVTAYAAEAAAGAASSQAGIPVIGPALAGAAAAAMFALVKGFVRLGFSKMAEGGLVTGGVQGRDSVPTLLQPGEFVLTKEQTDSLRQGGGGGLGGSPTINIELSSSLPPSRAEMKKYVRQNIVPALRELRAQGMF